MTESNEQDRLARLLLIVFVFVFGFQSMRVLFGSLTWYLRDTLGVGVIDLVPISLAPFLLGAVVPIVSKFLGVRRSLWLGVTLLLGARIAIQVLSRPGGDYWASSVATLAFVGLVPLLFNVGRTTFSMGVVLALAVDSAIKGLGLSLDLAYQPGWRPVLAVVAISLAIIWSLLSSGDVRRRGVSWASGPRLLALAPFLFFELLIFQSPGWASEVVGVPAVVVQVVIAGLNIGAVFVMTRFRANRPVYVLAVLTVSGAALTAEGGAVVFGIFLCLAILLGGVLLEGALPSEDSRSATASSTYLTLGLIGFLVFGLAYYLPLDLSLGFDQAAVRIAGAVLLFVFGLVGLRGRAKPSGLGGGEWVFAAAAFLLPLAGAIAAVSSGTRSIPSDNGTVRFMSYNLHSAFNTDGALDVEAIAQVIEDSEAEVVGLQEVPRGRLLSGTTDLLLQLQVRLGFEHVAYFGTTDPVWGNAILSRFPIVDTEAEYLPQAGTPLRRGYLGASLDIDGVELLVISTHLQHVNDQDFHDLDPEADLLPVHTAQIVTILDTWGGQSPAILMGDFNARPEWAQISMLFEAGWVDSWVEAGIGDGYTSNAADPKYRIDYVFHTDDVAAIDAGILNSTASDHFPVVVDVTLR